MNKLIWELRVEKFYIFEMHLKKDINDIKKK